jgi:hypothetical protein
LHRPDIPALGSPAPMLDDMGPAATGGWVNAASRECEVVAAVTKGVGKSLI